MPFTQHQVICGYFNDLTPITPQSVADMDRVDQTVECQQ